MKKKNVIVPIIIFTFAGLLVVLGIIQLNLFITPQLEMLREAAEQGVAKEQIDEYYRQHYWPEVINYVINAFGMAAILVASGFIYLKIGAVKYLGQKNEIPAGVSKRADDDLVTDDFFADFEPVGKSEDKKK